MENIVKESALVLIALLASSSGVFANAGHAPEGTALHIVQHGSSGWLIAAAALIVLGGLSVARIRTTRRNR
jgi:hypothetical protein